MKLRKSFLFLSILFLAVACMFGVSIDVAFAGDKAVTVGGRATYPILDEDAMGSDSDKSLATQQSIKAYVDTRDQVMAGGVAAPGTVVTSDYLAVSEYGAGLIHKTVITAAALPMALADVADTVAYVGTKLYDFPAGAIMIVGATADLELALSSAGVNADWDGDFGVGTVTASNNATLATTEQNIIPTTATPQASESETTATGQSTATENAVVDGTTTALDMYLNFLVDDADQDVTTTACNLLVTGTITVYWINLGDY